MRRKTKYYLVECTIVVSFTVVLLIFSIPRFLNVQNINRPMYFPDPLFRTEVEKYLGVKPGQPFSVSEAAQMGGLLSLKGKIGDLKIGEGAALEVVDCHNNQLKSIQPLVSARSLSHVDIRYNVLTEDARIDVETIKKRINDIAKSDSTLKVLFQYEPQCHADFIQSGD